MTKRVLKDIVASVRQRLLTYSQERGEDFQLTLIYYALERLMYRLSRSAHRDRFILKGALLFSVWSHIPHRATRDLDLLGHGDPKVDALVQAFQEICRVPVEDDGLTFMAETISGREIREGDEYQGIRLSFEARLGVARIPIQVDIGFGDAVLPKPEPLEYPTILDFPAPRLLAYSRETVIAEKFQAMVELGIANSRMKDFFDLWFLAGQFDCDGGSLSRSIRATFARRKTSLPMVPPLCLTSEFSADRDKQAQWRGFLKRTGLHVESLTLEVVLPRLEQFLMPPTLAAARGEAFDSRWPAGGPWK